MRCSNPHPSWWGRSTQAMSSMFNANVVAERCIRGSGLALASADKISRKKKGREKKKRKEKIVVLPYLN